LIEREIGVLEVFRDGIGDDLVEEGIRVCSFGVERIEDVAVLVENAFALKDCQSSETD
jgi:hypothetical protein